MSEKKSKEKDDERPSLRRGPLGYGDPDDKRLRKTEKNIIIPKMILEHAVEKCSESFNSFLDCAKEAGLLVNLKCRAENQAKNDCITMWAKNEEFVKEITDKYLEARTHYRKTGKPLLVYDRVKKTSERVSDHSIS